MSVAELIEYLSRFDPKANVSALIADLEKRLAYKVDGYQLITDLEYPVLMFELGKSTPLDDLKED